MSQGINTKLPSLWKLVWEQNPWLKNYFPTLNTFVSWVSYRKQQLNIVVEVRGLEALVKHLRPLKLIGLRGASTFWKENKEELKCRKK
jgi:hypothetical protein